jgi:hypothetical protein
MHPMSARVSVASGLRKKLWKSLKAEEASFEGSFITQMGTCSPKAREKFRQKLWSFQKGGSAKGGNAG